MPRRQSDPTLLTWIGRGTAVLAFTFALLQLIRRDGEWIHLNRCPVGYTAVPYPVGGNGNLFHFNLEMNF